MIFSVPILIWIRVRNNGFESVLRVQIRFFTSGFGSCFHKEVGSGSDFQNMLEKLKNNIQYLPQMLYFYIKAFLPYFGFDIENVGLCVLVWMLAVFSWLLFLSLFMDSVSLFNYLFLFFIIIKTHNLGYGELKLGALLRRVFPIV